MTHSHIKSLARYADFNPHLPHGRWRILSLYLRTSDNFNPHLPRGRWLRLPVLKGTYGVISIHTFLAEGDYSVFLLCASHSHFNPHLPRGRWLFRKPVCASAIGFQSTPSSRKVTLRSCSLCHVYLHFNPHLPRGRWRNWHYNLPRLLAFQSTPSSRKVTSSDL